MASNSNLPDVSMSSDSDSDYQPAEEAEEEDEQSEGEMLAQAYLERLLAGESDDGQDNQEEGGAGGAIYLRLYQSTS